jgi:2-dehydro-3-deoxyglucarate aldolase/4-hydroxy-2-oxoheptanedioate aldolase
VSGAQDGLASGLLERIRAGEAVFGTFLGMGSPVATEIASRAGFDWLMLDLEHGAGGEASLLGLLHAAAAGGSAVPLVRVESAARLRIGRALDLGAAGIMLPRVDTAGEARAAVRCLRYPPDGDRGVALMARAGGYGTLSHAGVAEINRRVLGIVQIESGTAVEQAAEIAAEDGADVLFVGPTDLTHSLGIPGDFADPAYDGALERVLAACEAAGKCGGILARTLDEAAGYLDRGFRFVGLGSDAALLAAGMRGVVAQLRDLRVAV